MDRLAIFDVDYTLTRRETQVELLRYLIRHDLRNLRWLPNSAAAGLGFLLGRHDEKASKEQNLKMLRGISETQLNELGRRFMAEAVTPLLYRDGIRTLRRHHREGMRVILNSASPEFYIREFERSPCIEKAIGTRFSVEDGIFTGEMIGANNKGEEKIRRLMEYLQDDPIDWAHSVMYSDSLSDRPLMELTGQAFLINHKPDPDFPVLHWK